MDFSFLLDLIPGSAMVYIHAVTAIISASAVMMSLISKHTKNKADDRVAEWLGKAYNFFGLLVPSSVKYAEKRVTQQKPKIMPPVVHPRKP